MNYKISSYKKVEVETNDPIKLVIMLFEGAINFTEKAKKRMMDNKVAEKGILISKVMAIVDELHSSLDMKHGGEVAVNMNRIYLYITERLSDANMQNDTTILTEVIQHFRVLKQAWVKVYNLEESKEELGLGSAKHADGVSITPKVQYAPQPVVQQVSPQANKEMKPIEIMG